MARIRSIHPGLSSDEAYMSMSMAAKSAWPILWTEADDHGVFEWKPIVLKARIFPADNVDFGAVLTEYETLGCVQKMDVDGKLYGFIHNFCKFQRPKHPSYRYTFPEQMRTFVSFSGSPPPVGGEASPTPTEKPTQMKEEGGSRREEDKKDISASVDAAPKPERKSRKKPAISLPLEFPLDRDYPKRFGFSDTDIGREVERFRNHAKSQDRKCADWDAAWRNWVIKAAEFAGKSEHPPDRPSGSAVALSPSDPEWESWLAHTRVNGPRFVLSQMEQIMNVGTGAWTFPSREPPRQEAV